MRIYILVLSLTLLSACTSQFAYKHLDWIIIWYSGDFVTLNQDQQNQFEEQVLSLLDWHKSSELPLYQQQLIKLKNDLNNQNISEVTIEGHRKSIYKYWINIRSHINSQALSLIKQLDNKQIEELFNELSEKNKERLEKHNQLDLKERTEELYNRWIDTLETMIGSINESQLTLLNNYLNKQHDLTIVRLQYLGNYQAELQNAMMDPMDDIRVMSLLNDPVQLQPQEYKVYLKNNQQSTDTFLSNFSSTLSDKQLKYFTNVINDHIHWITEIKSSQLSSK